MKYFDAHSHYTHGKFNRDRHGLFAEMQKEGVAYIVDCAGEGKNRDLALQLARKYDFYYVCTIDDHYYKTDWDYEARAGEINRLVDETVVKLKKLCEENKKIVAYGECYIDFRKVEKTAEEVRKQSFWFGKDLEVARKVGLPPLIHSGNADQEAFDVIKQTDMPDYGYGKGMLHCYLGPPQMALDYIDLGYLISISGLVTHRSARGKNLVEVVKKVPLTHMLIETDCPYLTPEPFRDRRNDSTLLRLTVEEIAKIKNLYPEEVAEQTMANAKAFFGIGES
ncbi:MAG: TatD family hydrolase [Defluviitaleaceae bacterium]|nr:TatD family hydrolase [Defluviitaleaceae bacterium]